MKVKGKYNSHTKNRRKMAEKQYRNTKIVLGIKFVSVCFSLGCFSDKCRKPDLLSNIFPCDSLCSSSGFLLVFWYLVVFPFYFPFNFLEFEQLILLRLHFMLPCFGLGTPVLIWEPLPNWEVLL